MFGDTIDAALMLIFLVAMLFVPGYLMLMHMFPLPEFEAESETEQDQVVDNQPPRVPRMLKSRQRSSK